MKSYKVQKIKNVNWGTTVALVNIDVLDAVGGTLLTIRDCKLIQGDFGSFVASPSVKVKEPYVNKTTGKLVEYYDIVFFEKAHREILNDLVANAYDPNAELNKWYDDNGTVDNSVTTMSMDDLKASVTDGMPS